MTSLQERVGFSSDSIERAADDAEAAFVLGDEDSGVRAEHIQGAPVDEARVTDQPVVPRPATVVAAPDAVPRDRFAAWVRIVFGGVRGETARSPRQPKQRRKHYPPRFSIEFETSLVDRERRRL